MTTPRVPIDEALRRLGIIEADDWVTSARIADDAVGVAQLSATGTASSSTFLRGDNAWDDGPVTSSDVTTIVEISQAAYDALSPPDADTLYVVTS